VIDPSDREVRGVFREGCRLSWLSEWSKLSRLSRENDNIFFKRGSNGLIYLECEIMVGDVGQREQKDYAR
jgi:hypothetical protein